ncbi:GNAT family N-acetyltransferase [Adhaeribacter soli]|uniref:GNAT family N-acetyltransferase n=1 Tax=Adhaeribacter soli TaxID=2607655 RepID=A0A5N1IM35_9BACT|nr:GNAT family N-acetyltransferase [Adhaeribacter soli]KAA9324967.1 GNAT family N-acetyltransferase [Adhaeribacter soli]
MLKYLQHSEIDFTLWDACVQRAEQHLVYAYAGYLNVSTGGSWDAIVEMQHGKYVSVFPLPFKKLLTEPFIYQPFHSQQLGLFTTPESRETTVAPYLGQIPKRLRKVYLQLNTGNTFEMGHLPKGFSSVPRITFHLNLTYAYEVLKESFATNLKRNIKKAKKEKFEVTETENLPDLIKLYRQTRGKELKEVKDRHYALFQKQYVFLQKNSLAQLLEIRKNNELIAGALFLKQPGKLIFLFSATSETGKQHGAMPFLISRIIKQYAGTPTILDFEGSSIPNLARFYSSFGAKPVTYLSVSRNNLPWYLKPLLK